MLVRAASPIASLPTAVPRPRNLIAGTWAASRLDTAGDPDFGPSLLELVMWFPLDDAAVARTLGASHRVATVTMDRDAVRAVLPDGAELPTIGDAVEVTGESYPPAAFEGSGYFGARAIHLHGGLLVAVRSGG